MEIAHGVFAYRGRGGDSIKPGAGSSCVIVIKGDTTVMIDSGVIAGNAYKELRSAMNADCLDLTTLEWILHTHCHWDHINADLRFQMPGKTKIAAGKMDVPFIENREKIFKGFIEDFGVLKREVFPLPLWLARLFIRVAWGKQPRLTVDKALEDGDIVDVGRKIKAMSLPGHTAGHMGYWIPDEGVLVFGDLIDFENSQGMDINNPHSNYESALASVKKALEMEPEIIIPGHGEPTIGQAKVREQLEKAVESGLAYPELIRGALSSTPQRLKKLTYKIFPDTTFSMESMTMMLVLTVLLYMEKQETTHRTTDGSGKIAWMR